MRLPFPGESRNLPSLHLLDESRSDRERVVAIFIMLRYMFKILFYFTLTVLMPDFFFIAHFKKYLWTDNLYPRAHGSIGWVRLYQNKAVWPSGLGRWLVNLKAAFAF